MKSMNISSSLLTLAFRLVFFGTIIYIFGFCLLFINSAISGSRCASFRAAEISWYKSLSSVKKLLTNRPVLNTLSGNGPMIPITLASRP